MTAIHRHRYLPLGQTTPAVPNREQQQAPVTQTSSINPARGLLSAAMFAGIVYMFFRADQGPIPVQAKLDPFAKMRRIHHD